MACEGKNLVEDICFLFSFCYLPFRHFTVGQPKVGGIHNHAINLLATLEKISGKTFEINDLNKKFWYKDLI